MSKTNNLIVIARGTQESAVSYDGTNFTNKHLPPQQSWRFIAGTSNKFAYAAYDDTTPKVQKVYSITDSANWKSGLLPIPSNQPCIVAIARSSDYIYSSFDGRNFAIVKPVNHYYQTCAATVTSTSDLSFSPRMKNLVLSVVSTTSASRFVSNLKLVVASALSRSGGKATIKGNSVW
jgi:hypothetical protein